MRIIPSEWALPQVVYAPAVAAYQAPPPQQLPIVESSNFGIQPQWTFPAEDFRPSNEVCLPDVGVPTVASYCGEAEMEDVTSLPLPAVTTISASELQVSTLRMGGICISAYETPTRTPQTLSVTVFPQYVGGFASAPIGDARLLSTPARSVACSVGSTTITTRTVPVPIEQLIPRTKKAVTPTLLPLPDRAKTLRSSPLRQGSSPARGQPDETVIASQQSTGEKQDLKGKGKAIEPFDEPNELGSTEDAEPGPSQATSSKPVVCFIPSLIY